MGHSFMSLPTFLIWILISDPSPSFFLVILPALTLHGPAQAFFLARTASN